MSMLRGDALKNHTSRRSFLGISALGLAAAVVPDVALPMAAATAKPAFGNDMSSTSPEICIWVTSGAERFAVAPQAVWRAAAGTTTGDHLQLNPSTKFQEI